MIFKTRIPSMLYGVVLRAREPVSAPKMVGIRSFSVAQFHIDTRLVFFMCGLVAVASFTMLLLWSSLQTVSDESSDHKPLFVRGDTTPTAEGSIATLRHTTDLQRIQLSKGDTRGLPKTVCPEIDIPGEENNVSIDFNETTVYNVEEALFQISIYKVRKLVKAADLLVKQLYVTLNCTSSTEMTLSKSTLNETTLNEVKLKTKVTPDESYKQEVVEALSDALILDNYIYAPGGHWIPATCLPRWKVAIVIPFRDRFSHLSIFLKHLIPFLQRQYIEFGIFVVEQANEMLFNRAMLMNVGFVESLKLNSTRWDCFIFHDVDHIPLNHANYYGCGHMPRHFVSGSSKWNYKLLYSRFFGAVTGFTRTQIEKFNGFPNVYWGWGGEDDDILYRLRHRGIFRTRSLGVMGFYDVIPHNHSKSKENPNRICLLRHFADRVYSDGLSNLQYSKPKVTVSPLYINISVDIQPVEWNKKWTVCSNKKSQKSQRKSPSSEHQIRPSNYKTATANRQQQNNLKK